jgi:hypothetical protein
MYCPKCGNENIEDANFCRGCGADLAPISQALSGRVPEKRSAGQDLEGHSHDQYRRPKRAMKEPRLDKAITNIFTGIGFILVAAMCYVFAPAGKIWWFWLLIPAFTTLGGGVAEYVRYKQWKGEELKLPGSSSGEPRAAAAAVPPARVSALPPRNTSEMVPPPSVTEGTTRHLNIKAEAPPRDT